MVSIEARCVESAEASKVHTIYWSISHTYQSHTPTIHVVYKSNDGYDANRGEGFDFDKQFVSHTHDTVKMRSHWKPSALPIICAIELVSLGAS